MVGIYLANTDNAWFDFLSPQNFHAIKQREILAFRLKSPRNVVGGFGLLSTSTVLPLQTAWETFEIANGAPSYEVFRSAIQALRSDRIGPASIIGCRILSEPVFLRREAWFELPASWSRNIVGGKRFSTDDPEGLQLWNRLLDAAQFNLAYGGRSFSDFAQARYGPPTLITPRLGQGAFRIAVTEAYGRECALSGGKVLPALEAAHIKPYGEGGLHERCNGILLRKDIHSVFDTGYATIDTDYRFVVSDKVKSVFNNGNEYRKLHGTVIRLPRNLDDRPAIELLRWHNENRFLG
jgi:putative restriction endonuclease